MAIVPLPLPPELPARALPHHLLERGDIVSSGSAGGIIIQIGVDDRILEDLMTFDADGVGIEDRGDAEGGMHDVKNGLLLRRDVHGLFDREHVTVTPEWRFEVSRRIKEEFEKGRDYYAMHGRKVDVPKEKSAASRTDGC